jgi:hypothetical protein
VGEIDYTDPMVRRMLDLNHRPTELTITRTRDAVPLIACEQDGQPWPCAIRLALRQIAEGKSE